MNFTELKNAIDSNLTIIRHDQTGYFNITAAVKMVHREMIKNGEFPSRAQSKFVITHWLSLDITKQLFDACSAFHNIEIEDLKFEIPNNSEYDVSETFSGTYIHPDMYDNFISWLNPKYTLQTSNLLKQIHKQANEKNTNHSMITKLELENEQLRKIVDHQSQQFAKLLEYSNKTADAFYELQEAYLQEINPNQNL